VLCSIAPHAFELGETRFDLLAAFIDRIDYLLKINVVRRNQILDTDPGRFFAVKKEPVWHWQCKVFDRNRTHGSITYGNASNMLYLW
jgi:hypothetical protein